jgi:hypothetical protein
MAKVALRNRRQSIEVARAGGNAPDPIIGASWVRSSGVVETSRTVVPVDIDPVDALTQWEESPIRRSGVSPEKKLAWAAEAGGLVAAVTNETGRILWSSGGRQMRRRAEQVGFMPGGCWDEASAGTNALGLALHTGEPATVFSAEHWIDAVHDWVCWSVPIHTPDGRILGVIDLSGRWDTASPMAALAVETIGRLIEEHLPLDAVCPSPPPQLELRLLGHAEVALGNRRLRLTPRQVELLAALALEGPATLDELRDRVYGDRPVALATAKAEVSHLRRLLGGAIGSRPYCLTLPVNVDVLNLRKMLEAGNVGAAVSLYAGQLLPESEAPFAIDNRHLIDALLRQSLLHSGSTSDLLRYAEVHRYDLAVLEKAVAQPTPSIALHHEAFARLERARRG